MTTKVLYAGKFRSQNIVSVFTNPPGQTGSNVPLSIPVEYLDRIIYDSRLDYLNITRRFAFSKPFGLIGVNTSATKKGKTGANVPIEINFTTVLAFHNLGYIPAFILLDGVTKEAVCGHVMLQNENNNSFRIIYAAADTQYIYLKEKAFIRIDSLPSLTKTFNLIIFNKQLPMPEFI